MQDEIWHQFGIQKYNGNVLSVYSVPEIVKTATFCKISVLFALK